MSEGGGLMLERRDVVEKLWTSSGFGRGADSMGVRSPIWSDGKDRVLTSRGNDGDAGEDGCSASKANRRLRLNTLSWWLKLIRVCLEMVSGSSSKE